MPLTKEQRAEIKRNKQVMKLGNSIEYYQSQIKAQKEKLDSQIKTQKDRLESLIKAQKERLEFEVKALEEVHDQKISYYEKEIVKAQEKISNLS